ncbi:MAG: hypothetical protein COA43_04925 [Robiginitomaculum sp.]|nr:MAG: hypothetical protein COA43_04925 [Robiginitomaculum sp.]
MDWMAIKEHGINALGNGLASFFVAAAIGLLIYGLYKIHFLAWVAKGLGWFLRALDTALEKLVWVTGVSEKKRLRRWGQFIAVFVLLTLLGAFIPKPSIALFFVVIALVLILAIYRHWERDENKRLSEIQKGRAISDREDLTQEMLAALGLLLFFIPLGFARLGEMIVFLSGDTPTHGLESAWYVWGELLKAVPLVDWSEVFGVPNLSGVEAQGKTGASLTFVMRVMFDLLILAGLIRIISIIRSINSGHDIRNLEEGLKSDDETKIEAAITKLGELAGQERRNALSHLFEITNGTRSDGKLKTHKWREKSARSLVDAANKLTIWTNDLSNLDNFLLGIEAYKTAAQYLEPHDPIYWATIQNELGIASVNLSELTVDHERLKQAEYFYLKALKIRSNEKEELVKDWANTQNNLGFCLYLQGSSLGSKDIIERALSALEQSLTERDEEKNSLGWAQTKHNVALALLKIGELTAKDAYLIDAVSSCHAALQIRKIDIYPDLWVASRTLSADIFCALGIMQNDNKWIEQARTEYSVVSQFYLENSQQRMHALIQNRIATALFHEGTILNNPTLLEQAITKHKEQLDIIKKSTDPLRWASIHNDLGAALWQLGQIRDDKELIVEAKDSFYSTLEVFNEHDSPSAWAQAQQNLGNSLALLASDIDGLKRALSAYEAALKVRVIESSPSSWAHTMLYYGLTLSEAWKTTHEKKYLKQALNVLESISDWHAQNNNPEGVEAIEQMLIQLNVDN